MSRDSTDDRHTTPDTAPDTEAVPATTPADAPPEHSLSLRTPARRASRERIRADAKRVGRDAKRVSRDAGKGLGALDYARPKPAGGTTSAPAATSLAMTGACPSAAAHINAVCPSQLSRANGSAPYSNKDTTLSTTPVRAATINGVSPVGEA